ncbi:MAG: hypothetical protein ACI80V_003882 [Rhodothermales bacterium]|jgi:hypothetical protein
MDGEHKGNPVGMGGVPKLKHLEGNHTLGILRAVNFGCDRIAKRDSRIEVRDGNQPKVQLPPNVSEFPACGIVVDIGHDPGGK